MGIELGFGLAGNNRLPTKKATSLDVERLGLDVTPNLATGVDDELRDRNPPLRNFHLAQNYPNPFNPATTIEFRLPAECMVRLRIYNMLGRLVRTLEDRRMTAGEYIVRWDGEDDSGRTLGSGIYFLRIEAGEFSQARRMVLLK